LASVVKLPAVACADNPFAIDKAIGEQASVVRTGVGKNHKSATLQFREGAPMFYGDNVLLTALQEGLRYGEALGLGAQRTWILARTFLFQVFIAQKILQAIAKLFAHPTWPRCKRK